MAANGKRILREWRTIHLIQMKQVIDEMRAALDSAPGVTDINHESWEAMKQELAVMESSWAALNGSIKNAKIIDFERPRTFKTFQIVASDVSRIKDVTPIELGGTARDPADAAERFIEHMQNDSYVAYTLKIYNKGSGIIYNYDSIGDSDKIDGKEPTFLLLEVVGE